MVSEKRVQHRGTSCLGSDSNPRVPVAQPFLENWIALPSPYRFLPMTKSTLARRMQSLESALIKRRDCTT